MRFLVIKPARAIAARCIFLALLVLAQGCLETAALPEWQQAHEQVEVLISNTAVSKMLATSDQILPELLSDALQCLAPIAANVEAMPEPRAEEECQQVRKEVVHRFSVFVFYFLIGLIVVTRGRS